jgi:hypothetical protein
MSSVATSAALANTFSAAELPKFLTAMYPVVNQSSGRVMHLANGVAGPPYGAVRIWVPATACPRKYLEGAPVCCGQVEAQ